MTDELTRLFTPYLESLLLIPSSGGRFEVTAGDQLIFSKAALGRHAEPGEITRLLEKKVGVTAMSLD